MERLLAQLVFVGCSVMIRAFVAMKLWTWYAVALFSLPSLGLAQCVGVCTLLSVFTHQIPSGDYAKDPDYNEAKDRFVSLVVPFIPLLIGWTAKRFI